MAGLPVTVRRVQKTSAFKPVSALIRWLMRESFFSGICPQSGWAMGLVAE
jgi:hypothetical protein